MQGSPCSKRYSTL